MLRKIRKGVFETNSSSCHSISIASNAKNYMHLYPSPEDNKIHVSFGEFGWEYERYRDPYNKLSYLLTMIMENHSYEIKSMDEFYELEEFKILDELIRDECGCEGIYLESDECYYDKDWNRFYIDGYIDHQSMYGSVIKFLGNYGISMYDFIFDKNVCLVIDNDNH